MNLGGPEILVILLVALLVFGPNKIPEVARQVGRGMREIRRLQDNLRGDVADLLDLHDDHDDEPTAPFHPVPTELAPSPARTGPRPRPLRSAPARPVPGPPPSAMPSRFRTPSGGRMAVPHRDVAPSARVARATAVTTVATRAAAAPSRFRTPRPPAAS